MVSAIGTGLGVSSIAISKKAGVPAMDASLNEGKSQGLDRAMQRKASLGETAKPGETSATSKDQHVGPARQIALDKALGRGGFSEQAMMMHFQSLNPNQAPGPKPASALHAESKYLEARAAF